MEGKRSQHVSKTRGHVIYVYSASDGIAATQKVAGAQESQSNEKGSHAMVLESEFYSNGSQTKTVMSK